MSIQRMRPIDTLQNILSSFKQFEKKLDKLQDDVSYHGHTLSELHVMIANISGGNTLNKSNEKLEDMKKLVNKTTAMHPDSKFHHEKPLKPKRRGTMQQTSKLTSQSFQGQRNRINATKDINPDVTKTSTCPKIVISGKRVSRPRKGEALRTQKSMKLRKREESLSP